MRRALIFSLVWHALAFGLFFLKRFEKAADPGAPAGALSTRVLSEKDFVRETKVRSARRPEKLQLVQVDDQLKSPDAPLENQRVFLGRHNQRVDRDTRAARVGEFKNVLKEGLRDARELFKLAKVERSQEAVRKNPPGEPLSRGPASVHEPDPGHGKTTRFPASEIGGKPGEGFSATDDYLPDIAIGANTLLNSREYKYASFFERIREKLNHQWQHRLRTEIEGLAGHGVDGFTGERITKLRVILNANGEVVRIDTEGSAGYVELDRAAIGAFHAAGPFQNPPKELLEGTDQTLSIDWHFVVMGLPDRGFSTRVDRSPAGLR